MFQSGDKVRFTSTPATNNFNSAMPSVVVGGTYTVKDVIRDPTGDWVSLEGKFIRNCNVHARWLSLYFEAVEPNKMMELFM
jgi:hypothetical protein